MANNAKEGDTVKVHYKGLLDDGTVFDSSYERDPLEFRIGEHRVIPGFENAVIGMEPGQSKKERIEADSAYGQRRDDMVISISREQVPSEIDPQVGQRLQMSTPDGRQVPVVIAEVADESVKIDANHPLAGKDLTFELELVEIT